MVTGNGVSIINKSSRLLQYRIAESGTFKKDDLILNSPQHGGLLGIYTVLALPLLSFELIISKSLVIPRQISFPKSINNQSIACTSF
jgi:hypothetical protein